jgi:hypothetical protein
MTARSRHVTRALNQAALLTAGLEGLRGGSWLTSAASHLVSLLIVALFCVGLGVRLARWLREAICSTERKGRGADRAERPVGRPRADDVPVRRPRRKDDDPPLGLPE